jgi:hypothetical protein
MRWTVFDVSDAASNETDPIKTAMDASAGNWNAEDRRMKGLSDEFMFAHF